MIFDKHAISVTRTPAANPGDSVLTLPPKHALQGGGGWDAFVTKHLAINVELGIKYNKGGANLVQGATSTPLGDIDLTAFVGTVGLRYFFWTERSTNRSAAKGTPRSSLNEIRPSKELALSGRIRPLSNSYKRRLKIPHQSGIHLVA
jgi:hypothetical protein